MATIHEAYADKSVEVTHHGLYDGIPGVISGPWGRVER